MEAKDTRTCLASSKPETTMMTEIAVLVAPFPSITINQALVRSESTQGASCQAIIPGRECPKKGS